MRDELTGPGGAAECADDVRDALPLLLHGRLAGAERARVEAHVATCAAWVRASVRGVHVPVGAWAGPTTGTARGGRSVRPNHATGGPSGSGAWVTRCGSRPGAAS